MANWYDGLPVGVANALMACGFTSREQVANVSSIDLLALPKVGFRSACLIQAWLGRPTPETVHQMYNQERAAGLLRSRLIAAEELLCAHGYKVKKPKAQTGDE